MGVARFERFFRAAAGLDVHKDDLKRYSDFVNHKLYDLLLIGQAKAKANDRDVIAPYDLPVTKGLHESIHQFRKMDEGLDLEPIIEQLETLPPLDLAYGDELVEQLPEVAGGLTFALATAFKTVDHKLESPHSEQWAQAFALFDLLL